jgi:GT2 family glycosyltransferase
MNRVAVVILNWNGIDDTMLCFDSLLKQTVPHFKIVIVDNGSVDDSTRVLHELQKDHPDKLTVLYNSHNKGFTGGVNTGISWAVEHDFDGVALINNDAVTDKKWLESLIREAKDEHIGIVTGLLLSADGKTIDSTGEQYSNWGLPFPRKRGLPVDTADKAGYTFGATGGSTLYKVALFKDIGLFDEDFFAYYEDTDISFRAQLTGWKVTYTPKAIAYHKQGASSNKIPGFTVYQTFKNLPLLFLKDIPRSLFFSIGIRFYFAYILMAGNAIKNGTGSYALKGVGKSIILTPRALNARFKIQKSKTVPTSYIKSILWPDLPPDQTGIRKLRKFFTGKP